MMRRLFDLIASSAGLALFAPVMVTIGILVIRDSEGPALFRQERIGRDGRPFTLLKFRSMATNTEPEGPLVTAASDARITKVGAKLRSSKLDELPQLVNVLRGDMSIVGPRPEVAKYADLWSVEDRDIILSVRPGITDPVSLQFRDEEVLLAGLPDPEEYYRTVLLREKSRMVREYIATRTLAGDVCLAFQTLMQIALRISATPRYTKTS